VTYEVRSISQLGGTEPFELQVARGQVPGHRAIFRSAYSKQLELGETYAIWNLARGYTFPSSASLMTLSSDSASDVGVAVLILGLNADYVEIQEVVVLNGQSAVSTTNSYLRINDLLVVSGNAVGSIYIGTGAVSGGVPANVYNFIFASDNASMTAVYTVPAGHSLYIKGGSISAFTENTNKSVTVDFYISNSVRYRVASILSVSGFQHYPYDPPNRTPEKTDVFDLATTDDNQLAEAVVNLSGILVKEEGPL